MKIIRIGYPYFVCKPKYVYRGATNSCCYTEQALKDIIHQTNQLVENDELCVSDTGELSRDARPFVPAPQPDPADQAHDDELPDQAADDHHSSFPCNSGPWACLDQSSNDAYRKRNRLDKSDLKTVP